MACLIRAFTIDLKISYFIITNKKKQNFLMIVLHTKKIWVANEIGKHPQISKVTALRGIDLFSFFTHTLFHVSFLFFLFLQQWSGFLFIYFFLFKRNCHRIQLDAHEHEAPQILASVWDQINSSKQLKS